MAVAERMSAGRRRLEDGKSLPVLVFIVACAAMDISFGADALKVGNLIMCAGAALAVLLALRLGTRRPQRRLFTLADGIFAAYLVLIGASAMWSPSKIDTIAQLVFLSTLWGATMVLGRENILALVRYTIYAALFVAVASLVLAVVAPDVAYQPLPSGPYPELRGIFHHQLRLGVYMGMGLGLLVLAKFNGDLPRVFPDRMFGYAAAALIFVALILAMARLYTLFVFASLAIALLMPRSPIGKALTLAVIAAIVGALFYDQGALIDQLDARGVDLTLSGRTTIWMKTLVLADARPMLGYGFPSFDNKAFDWYWGLYRPSHPHNSFLQAYFETGLVGLALVLLIVGVHILIALRHAGAERRYSYTLFLVSMAVLGSLTGANYGSKPGTLFAYVMLAIAIEARRGDHVIDFRRRTKSRSRGERARPLQANRI